jgi:uncharacterized membrane protein SirB2
MITLHLTTIVLTISGFCLRGYWMLTESPLLRRVPTRVLPHVNDTVLFASGAWLAVTTGQYPFAQAWLTAKLLGLIAYIVTGALALNYAPTREKRIGYLALAILCFAYVAAVALTRSPLPLVM